MGYEITTTIEKEKCIGCGKCVAVCPYDAIELIDSKAVVTGKKSMHCGQCAAVCAQQAVTVDDLVVPTLQGELNAVTSQLFDTVMHRRSCRNYKKDELTRTEFENLITFGQWAPSGTNAQKWKFTVIPNRSSVEAYADAIGRFYKKLNRQAENPALRLYAKLFLKDALGKYYRRYYRQVQESLTAWEVEKKDLLFHGATGAIIVSMSPGAFCAHDDALLASQNICLGAHAMGIGSCLIGFAVEAMKRDNRIAQVIGIPEAETVYAVIALGRPKYQYPNPSGRLPVPPRYFTR
ncbi:MAG: nitroreductase family protein [Deltaproteobacteria bacterium]|nr:nitroreductase family protein [Deltaproteobacteria bacterium]MBN2670945.1 nitroreductase family protein [Deltaproteobacteria bacterium]